MGINTLIKQTEAEMLQLINSKIQMGIPHSVLELILDNMLLKLENETKAVLQAEKNKEETETKVTEKTIFDEEKGDA